MNQEINEATRMDLAQPMPPEAVEFARKLHGMLDGKPNDEAAVAEALTGMDGMFDMIAAGLYSLASMLVGEGEDSIRLVETAVANTEVSACSEPEEARRSSRRALAEAAVKMLAERDAENLAAPVDLEPVQTCIGDDALDAAGVSRDELERMLNGPDRERVRKWLESLPTALRTIFVLKAVAGFSKVEVAQMFEEHGGPLAHEWTPEAVRELYRQGLCSLASQIIHAGVGEGLGIRD